MNRAVFRLAGEEAESTWTVQATDGTYTVSISELFPSGMYDVHEIKSPVFGESLLKRMDTGGAEAVLQYLKSNRSTINVADAVGIVGEEDAVRIVSEFVPLNDAERQFRDEMRGVCRGS